MSVTMEPVDVQMKIKTADVRYVKELYPRPSGEDNAAIERYRAAIDLLPPIVIARNGILVDGFHRWQAHKREGLTEIDAINLGNLSDIEILKEAIRRNASHGAQLITKDKRAMAATMYTKLVGTPDERYEEISILLSITKEVARKYCADARQNEVEQQKAKAWDMHLDCCSVRQIEDEIGIDQATVNRWIVSKRNEFQNETPPESRQHFDTWNFTKSDSDSTYFGQMPPQIVENLLWFYTKPGDIVFDPFAGGGTTIKMAKEMGRRVWSSDIKPSTPILPIHEHNILDGWPADAPNHPDFILLDPPYWKQALEKYGNHPQSLGNMTLEDFYATWAEIIKTCAKHIKPDGHIAYIISPTFNKEDGSVIDHSIDMLPACWEAGLIHKRRISIPYSTQQTSAAQVEWARGKKFMLARDRHLVILTKCEG